jgi:small subunit ribosomal protein S28e
MSESEENGNESDDATPAEVVEVVGKTGMHGEAMQVKARVLGGSDKGRVLTRNAVGPVREGDIIMLMETAREAKSLSSPV